MSEAKHEPMIVKALNDLLDLLDQYPSVRGTISGQTKAGISVTIVIRNETIEHADP